MCFDCLSVNIKLSKQTKTEFLVIADPVQILEQVPVSAPRDFVSIPPHHLAPSNAPTIPNQEENKDGSR